MKISFSTLGCPGWSLLQAIALAARERYDGIELRFVEGDAALWKRSEFVGGGLHGTRARLADANLAVSCVDTSCFFHAPDAAARAAALDEGRRMLALAAALGAPGIRVFGDRVQPGATRESTEGWIADGVHALGEEARAAGLETWLETHGEFAAAPATASIIRRAATAGAAVLWDPANAFVENGESPATGYAVLDGLVHHVHIKDVRPCAAPDADTLAPAWQPVLMDGGSFPAAEAVTQLLRAGYSGYLSFEWEKRWHPSIEEPEVALPHFARWARRVQAHLALPSPR